MLVKQVVEITITDMQKGEVTGLILNDKKFVFSNDVKTKNESMLAPARPYKRQKNIIDKWLEANNIYKFTLDDFYKANPKQRLQKKRTEGYISRLIKEKVITQVSNDTFLVNDRR